MNELNHLESRLRSWTPRRPSTSLDRQIAALLDKSGRAVGQASRLSDEPSADVILLFAAPLTPALSPRLAKGEGEKMQDAEFVSFSPRAARGEGARRAGEGCRPEQRLVASQDDTGPSLLRLCLVRLAPVAACLAVCLLALREDGRRLSILPATNTLTLAFTSNVPALLLAQTNLPADPVRWLLEPVPTVPKADRPAADTPSAALPSPSQAPLSLGGQVERNVWFNGSARLARGWN